MAFGLRRCAAQAVGGGAGCAWERGTIALAPPPHHRWYFLRGMSKFPSEGATCWWRAAPHNVVGVSWREVASSKKKNILIDVPLVSLDRQRRGRYRCSRAQRSLVAGNFAETGAPFGTVARPSRYSLCPIGVGGIGGRCPIRDSRSTVAVFVMPHWCGRHRWSPPPFGRAVVVMVPYREGPIETNGARPTPAAGSRSRSAGD